MATQGNPQSETQDLEKMLKDYQVIQDQLRSVALQLDQLQAQKIDMEKAKEELDKAQGKVYITVGGVMVETTKEKALADISERASLNKARIDSMNKQYTELRNREKQLNEKITSVYKSGQGVA
jgi:prefoldin beta subunit